MSENVSDHSTEAGNDRSQQNDQATPQHDSPDGAADQGRSGPLAQASVWRRILPRRGAGRRRNATVTAAWITAVGGVVGSVAGSGLSAMTVSMRGEDKPPFVTTIVTPTRKGIFSHAWASTAGTQVYFYKEFSTVEFVCKILNGEGVSERKGDGRPLSAVSVWLMLAGEGGWINSIYTSLPGKMPSSTVPECKGDQVPQTS